MKSARTGIFGISVWLALLAAPSCFALQGGPVQPDYMQFEPSGMQDLVSLQTGNFSYSVPLGELPGPYGGFPLSMSYHAGISPQSEATWVGLGWTLNPGSISRDIRGVPDDQFHGGTLGYVYRYSAMQAWGLDVGWSMGAVSVGFNAPSTGGVGFSATVGLKVEGLAGVGFKVGTEALGMEASFGNSEIMDLNTSLMLSSGGRVTAGFGASGKDVDASAGVQYSTGSGAAYKVGFGDAHGRAKVGLTASSDGLNASVGSGPISTDMSRAGASVSVKGVSLSVANVSGKGGTHSSSVGFAVVVPVYPSVFSLGFSQSLHEYRMRSATSDYVYGYMYQAGPAIVADGENVVAGMPAANAASGSDSWNWTVKGRTLESVGSGEMYPAYDMYSVASEGVSGTFRPFTREQHRLREIVSNEKSDDDEVFVDYSTVMKDSADGWPYIGEFETDSSDVPVARTATGYYESYRHCVQSDSCSPYALYATRFMNEGNRLVYRKGKDAEDTLTTGMNFLFVGEGGYYESESYEGAKTRPRRKVSDILLKRTLGEYEYALYGSRKIEPIFEDDSPVGKLKGFVVTNSDGARYYFEQPVRSYLKVDYSINQEKGTPLFVDKSGSASANFLDNLGKSVLKLMRWGQEMSNPIGAFKNTYEFVFKAGELDENCKVENDDDDEVAVSFYTYQVNMNPHATQWLLTEIRGADFIRLGDSVYDNVGYNVKFRYTTQSLYRWRSPYARPGLSASDLPNYRLPRNGFTPEGCDSRMYQASFGVKEYVYLKSIETSTHRVEFELNDPVSEERVDGKGWEFDRGTDRETLPIVVQVAVAFEAQTGMTTIDSIVRSNQHPDGHAPIKTAYNKQTISLSPKWLYTNMKLPEPLAQRLGKGTPISVAGFESRKFPHETSDVVDTALYGMPENLSFSIDSNATFEQTTGNDSRYGLYRIRVRQSGDSVFAYRYTPTGDTLFNGTTVVFGESGNYDSHPVINWSELVFKGDSLDRAENQMRYLKKISYFVRGDTLPYREFRFGYDYTLHPKALNSYCAGHYPESTEDIANSPDSAAVGVCSGAGESNNLYGKLTLKTVTEIGCQHGRCSELPPFRFGYASPGLTSTRISSKEGWKNLSQNLIYTSPEDSIGIPQFPESYYDSITDVDASIVASSDAIDEWGFWNERAYAENRKVWQGFADYGASAWSLNRITEPSGGVVEVDYERDVYGNGEDDSDDRMYAAFSTADTCGKFASEYPVSNSDSFRVCIELGPLYWREQCLGPRPAFWDTVRPAGYSGNGFEYLDTMGIVRGRTVDTSRTVLFNVLGNMGTKVGCGLLGIGRCSRTRSVAVVGDGKPLHVLQRTDGNTSSRLLVLDRSMPYVDAMLQTAVDKINSKKSWKVKSRSGALWTRKESGNMRGGDLRVKRLIRHDMERTVTTEYEYAVGEIAQLPDSAYNMVMGNRFYAAKVAAALPDMSLSPKSRIVGFGDGDLLYVPGSGIMYPKVTVKNSGTGESNGKTVFEYITPESGVPIEYIDEETRQELVPFLRVNARIFVWGGDVLNKVYAERPFLVEFSLLDSARHQVGGKRKVIVARDAVTSFCFYDPSIRNVRYLAATSRFSTDSSLSVQHDTLALGGPLTDFNDMDVSVSWYMGTFIPFVSGVVYDNQLFSLHLSWLRSQREGRVPVLYKKVEYLRDSITLQTMDGTSQAMQDQRDDADFENDITYRDFTAFIGLNTKTSFYRGNDPSALLVRVDSSAYSTRVSDVLGGIASNPVQETVGKIGRQVERWGYERELKCKEDTEDKCEKQQIELYDRNSHRDTRNYTYVRYPAFQIRTFSFTGHDNQPSSFKGLWGKSVLENHLFDPLTGLPTATLARTPAAGGEMRKLTLKRAHYGMPNGDSSIANVMFRRNMLSQNYLDALYSGTTQESDPWNSIKVNDSLRSLSISPYRMMPDSLYPGRFRPLVAWGSFTSRREPASILNGSDLLDVVGAFQSTDPASGQSFPDRESYEGVRVNRIDGHFRVRESEDALERALSSHYAPGGEYWTGAFFPAGLSRTSGLVPSGTSLSRERCRVSTVGYDVSAGVLVPEGYTHIRCAVPESIDGIPSVAEYSVRVPGSPWVTVRDTVLTDTFELTLYQDHRLAYLRLYPANAEAKTFAYDRYGNMVRVVGEDNLSTYYEYDPFGHLVQVRDDDGVSYKVHYREYRNDARDEILLDSGGGK